MGKTTKLTKEEFILRAKQIHGDKYDYSKIDYINKHTKICIICPEHGEFWQSPNNHLLGNGCRKCWLEKNLYSKLSNTREFIEKAKQIHGEKYDYSKTNYCHSLKKVIITCMKHGDFLQTPNCHLNGQGCPICNESVLEKEIRVALEKENINHLCQYRQKWLGKQSLDFYLPDYNIAIECQGEQHYKPKKYFGGEKYFNKIIENDSKKEKLCENYGIKLFYYTKLKYLNNDAKFGKNIFFNCNDMLKNIK